MSSPVLDIQKDKTVQDAVEKMEQEHIGSLLVMDGSEQIGIITERDILTAVANKKLDHTLADFSSKPLITIDQNASLGEAAQIMLSKKIRRLMVTDDSAKICGILNIRDLTLAVHEKFLALFDI